MENVLKLCYESTRKNTYSALITSGAQHTPTNRECSLLTTDSTQDLEFLVLSTHCVKQTTGQHLCNRSQGKHRMHTIGGKRADVIYKMGDGIIYFHRSIPEKNHRLESCWTSPLSLKCLEAYDCWGIKVVHLFLPTKDACANSMWDTGPQSKSTLSKSYMLYILLPVTSGENKDITLAEFK